MTCSATALYISICILHIPCFAWAKDTTVRLFHPLLKTGKSSHINSSLSASEFRTLIKVFLTWRIKSWILILNIHSIATLPVFSTHIINSIIKDQTGECKVCSIKCWVWSGHSWNCSPVPTQKLYLRSEVLTAVCDLLGCDWMWSCRCGYQHAGGTYYSPFHGNHQQGFMALQPRW